MTSNKVTRYLFSPSQLYFSHTNLACLCQPNRRHAQRRRHLPRPLPRMGPAQRRNPQEDQVCQVPRSPHPARFSRGQRPQRVQPRRGGADRRRPGRGGARPQRSRSPAVYQRPSAARHDRRCARCAGATFGAVSHRTGRSAHVYRGRTLRAVPHDHVARAAAAAASRASYATGGRLASDSTAACRCHSYMGCPSGGASLRSGASLFLSSSARPGSSPSSRARCRADTSALACPKRRVQPKRPKQGAETCQVCHFGSQL